MVERIEQKVPVQVCRMVAEQQVRRVPVTTCRMVYEQKVEPYQVQVCRMVASQETVRVPRVVEKRIPITYTYRVPRTVVMRVPIEDPVRAGLLHNGPGGDRGERAWHRPRRPLRHLRKRTESRRRQQPKPAAQTDAGGAEHRACSPQPGRRRAIGAQAATGTAHSAGRHGRPW